MKKLSIENITEATEEQRESMLGSLNPLTHKAKMILESGDMESQLSDSQKKALELAQDEEFMKSILELDTPEQVQAAFAANGAEMSLEEVQAIGEIAAALIEKGGELTEEDLEEIAGGVVVTAGAVLGAATVASAGPLGWVIGGVALAGLAVVIAIDNNWRKIGNWFRRW